MFLQKRNKMEKTHILYIGMHPEILETVVRIANKNEAWHCIGTGDLQLAREWFLAGQIDLVMLGPGLAETEETELRSFLETEDPAVKVVQHYGGGSGLLSNEIMHALQGIA
jgi:hypothetical protein